MQREQKLYYLSYSQWTLIRQDITGGADNVDYPVTMASVKGPDSDVDSQFLNLMCWKKEIG